jgi:Protein of unknown function (DUF3684)
MPQQIPLVPIRAEQSTAVTAVVVPTRAYWATTAKQKYKLLLDYVQPEEYTHAGVTFLRGIGVSDEPTPNALAQVIKTVTQCKTYVDGIAD